MSVRRPDNPRAFTLIELLVVIAIIGALVAIIMPALSKARANSKRTVCASNLRQVGVGLRSYLDANGDVFPWASFLPSSAPDPVNGPTPIYLADILAPHLNGATNVFRCPQDPDNVTRLAPNESRSYFETEKSSYAYRSFGPMNLCGYTMAQVIKNMATIMGTTFPENTVWLMRDYDNFHATSGPHGQRRYLFYDNHVSDFELN